ncbi:site-specific integrase [Sphingomonas sp. BAUL-RG-20F-R05-02]|uniref:site-specific integrase n=1 Tax=Sphingomonas sp. BAUL-RG-20F-R05-02 TaxID=2914830 RepID=UPI001F5A7EDA|nr:site-specific integrase [Sphingomonas sp. BAUL-RG-20F-R05-02]
MVAMAEPWRHPETGTYYLRRQIPKPLREEFGGRQLWKRSLDTKDAAEARRVFAALNAELERRFEAARVAIEERAAGTKLTLPQAQAALARASALHRGSRFDRLPVLSNVFWAEEAGAARMGGARISILPDPTPANLATMDPNHLPGDVWLRIVRTRTRKDILFMAEHMVLWIHGDLRGEGGFGDLHRSEDNDWLLTEVVTSAIESEQADLRLLISSPHRPTGTRLRPRMTLGELVDEWKNKTPAPGSQGAHETSTTVADFIDYVGDLPVSQINGDHLYNFRDAVASLPNAMPHALRALTFNARLKACRDLEGPRVAPASVKRRIGHLQALITHAFNQRWIEANTGSGIRIEGYSKNTKNRRPFLDDELARLFSCDLFLKPTGWLETRNTVGDMTLAWMFLLGLTNGARIEEIGQTELANVKRDGGVLYLDLGADAVVKNENSRRMIPLHDVIIELGFETYVDALRSAGETRLFPDLKPNMFDKLCKEASRVANRLIDKVVSDDPRLAFHSLRHNFKDFARDATIEKYILDQIMGHAGVTTGDKYGVGARLKTLKRELDRISFDMLEGSGIKAAFVALDWTKALERRR